jgi:hypothetical protein
MLMGETSIRGHLLPEAESLLSLTCKHLRERYGDVAMDKTIKGWTLHLLGFALRRRETLAGNTVMLVLTPLWPDR